MIRDEHDFDEVRYWLDELYEASSGPDSTYLWRLLHDFLREVESDEDV